MVLSGWTKRHTLRRKALGVLALALVFLLQACAPAGDAELVYVGPRIEGIREIRQVDPAGEGERLFAATEGLGEGFFWFPDGQRAIVMVEDQREYFAADVTQEQILECLSCEIDQFDRPAFSPNGRSIAWGARDGIVLLNTDDFSSTLLAALEKPGWLTWSSRSDQIAFARFEGRYQIFRVDVGTGEVLRLTTYDGSDSTDHFAPAWSPKGDEIVFHALNRDGHRIMLMDADGSDVRMLTDWLFSGDIYDPGLQRPPVWSPDGEKLIFSQASPLGDTDIFVIQADGTGLRNLSNSPGNDWDPAWSPDGAYIAFVSNRDGDREIYVMNADGSEPRNVSRSPTTAEMNPAWRP